MMVCTVWDLSLESDADNSVLRASLLALLDFDYLPYHSFRRDNEMAPFLSRRLNLNIVSNCTELSSSKNQ